MFVGFYLMDILDGRRGSFSFFGAMVEAGFVQSLTGRRGAEPIGCS